MHLYKIQFNAILFFNLILVSCAWKPPLIWKEGINWVQMVVGIGIPVDLEDATITIGSAAKAYYLLPTNTSYPSYTTFEAKGRSLLRQGIYNTIESILQRQGFNDGKACLLKLICEYATKETVRNSLISRVVDVILRPSSTVEDIKENVYFSAEKMGASNMNCTHLFPECRNNTINDFFTEYVLT